MRARDKLMDMTEEEAFAVAMVLDLLEYDLISTIKNYKDTANRVKEEERKAYWLAEAEKLEERYNIIYGKGV